MPIDKFGQQIRIGDILVNNTTLLSLLYVVAIHEESDEFAITHEIDRDEFIIQPTLISTRKLIKYPIIYDWITPIVNKINKMYSNEK